MCKYESSLSKPNFHSHINYMMCIHLEMHRQWSGRQWSKLMALITYKEGDRPGAEREGRRKRFLCPFLILLLIVWTFQKSICVLFV